MTISNSSHLSNRPQLTGKAQVERLFQFAQAYSNSQQRVARNLSDHPMPDVQIDLKSLPQDSEWITHWSGEEFNREWLLKVKICPPTPCPKPPDILKDWLLPGWEKYSQQVRHVPEKTFFGIDQDKDTKIEKFEDEKKRLDGLNSWKIIRESWAKDQERHDPVRSLFSKLQTLRAELSKGSGEVELVLGAGVFEYKTDYRSYKHPLLIKSIGLEFDAAENIFTVVETERQTELYTDFLHDDELSIDLSPSASWRIGLESLHPLDRQVVTLLESIGAWLHNQPGLEKSEVTESSVIFLRGRGGWTSRAASDVLKDLAGRREKDLPAYLLKLAGSISSQTSSDKNDSSESGFVVANEAADILFALPANLEQLQLARSIERKDIVLVQGPPGTGKTHTIANLLGHLLSQGKRVLVTSHTSKALKVLRDKVPANIQSLCVSVLDDASKSKGELEQSVRAIAERMQEGSTSLSQKSQKLGEERKSLLIQIQNSRQRQQKCVRKEYESIVIGGESIAPLEAAKEVRNGRGVHDWIPGPLEQVELGKICPLSVSDLMWLYASQKNLSREDEATLVDGVINHTEIPNPSEFSTLVKDLDRNKQITQKLSGPLWSNLNPNAEDLKKLQSIIRRALDALRQLEERSSWMSVLVEEGADSVMPSSWREIFDFSNGIAAKARDVESLLFEYAPSIPDNLISQESIETLKEMREHAVAGKGFNSFSILFAKPLNGKKWKAILESAQCNDEKPTRKEHFDALIAHVTLSLDRKRLIRRWERQVVAIGGEKLPETTPEKNSEQWAPFMKTALGWFTQYWEPVKFAATMGRSWSDLESLTQPDSSRTPRLIRAQQLATNHLAPECDFHLADIQIRDMQAILEKLCGKLNSAPATKVMLTLARVSANVDPIGYEQAYNELARLNALKVDFEKRAQLLQKLEKGASRWAEQLRLRSLGFDAPLAPNVDLNAAWRWRQFQDELEVRSELNSSKIAQDLQRQAKQLQLITGELIATQCWSRQLAAAEKFRPHLVGWLDSMRRIGKATGKLVEKHRAEARKQLKNGQHAIPVWIMPLAEVFRSLNVSDRFDVVIIDEASQAGIQGLLAAYMGKKVVVVGDHEQVSPDAVGEVSNVAQALQVQFLENIPNKHLYDGKLSLYDMSRWVADGMLSLNEHFRCMPAIIGFSNQLSYDGRIKPLRDSNASTLLPVIPFKVQGNRQGKQKINKEEAFEIVALIKAMCEHKAYAHSTIGVISLLGTEQAIYIEQLIRQHIPASEIEKRKIICGNAAQFQGDEREVIFLSMVDSNEGDGPMRKQGDGANDLYKKRYNVAASRAQNQMWVLHSVDYQTDLKPDDIRRQLLDYCYAVAKKPVEITNTHRTDSEFERLVLKELLDRGYHVKTQYEVGAYRIDMVVEYEGRQLAVECDGEKWHSGTEKIAEDFARQAILERLGWTFHRIRGSLFFRDSSSAIQQLVERLNQLGICPKTTNDFQFKDNLIHEDLIRMADQFILEISE